MTDRELFTWNEALGVGYYPVTETHYDDAYFDTYTNAAHHGPVGQAINDFRVKLVNSLVSGTVLDFGIGDGEFIRRRGNCLGYDICPKAVVWLKAQGLFFDPWLGDVSDGAGIQGVTFFDSLEHLPDPGAMLRRVGRQAVFVTLPIFDGPEQALFSKHFKPREHFWYFTRRGLSLLMAEEGFVLFDWTKEETEIGREGIETFVFGRHL